MRRLLILVVPRLLIVASQLLPPEVPSTGYEAMEIPTILLPLPTTITAESTGCPILCVDGVNACQETFGGCIPHCIGEPIPTDWPTSPCETKSSSSAAVYPTYPTYEASNPILPVPSCSTVTSPATMMCDPVLKPGEFGVPFVSTYLLPTTLCKGRPPKYTSRVDYRDCYSTTTRSTSTRTRTHTSTTTRTSTSTATRSRSGSVRITPSPIPLPTTISPTPFLGPTCITTAVDAYITCGTSSVMYGYYVTSCRGQRASSSVSRPTCPSCTTSYFQQDKDCESTSVWRWEIVMDCPGSEPVTTSLEPPCPTEE